MMKHLLELSILGFLLLVVPSAGAQEAPDDCALARDPARCEARQAALATCADMHGSYKRACLEAALPVVDCSKSKNPGGCDRAQKAKSVAQDACKGKIDQELGECLKGEKAKMKPAKKKKNTKAKPRAKGKSKKPAQDKKA